MPIILYIFLISYNSLYVISRGQTLGRETLHRGVGPMDIDLLLRVPDWPFESYLTRYVTTMETNQKRRSCNANWKIVDLDECPKAKISKARALSVVLRLNFFSMNQDTVSSHGLMPTLVTTSCCRVIFAITYRQLQWYRHRSHRPETWIVVPWVWQSGALRPSGQGSWLHH